MSLQGGLSAQLDGTSPPFVFGTFDYFCAQAPLPLCSLVASAASAQPTDPLCYGRNIDINAGSFLLFQPATLFVQAIALLMTLTMIMYIRSKYTAVGRKEMVMFFYMYAATVLVDFLLISAIIPPAAAVYKYFAAIHAGLLVSTFWCLVYNGIVGYQWTEDGTPQALWTLRLTTLFVFLISFVISILTFLNSAGLSSSAPTALFIVYLILPALFLVTYVILQIILVVTTLDDRWPLGDLLFGLFFFALGLVMEFVFGPQLCELATHYVDGMFFGTICTLLGVMLVYKFWDSITKEDLEFAVSGKPNVWDARNPLLNQDGEDMYVGAGLPQQQRHSVAFKNENW